MVEAPLKPAYFLFVVGQLFDILTAFSYISMQNIFIARARTEEYGAVPGNRAHSTDMPDQSSHFDALFSIP